MGHRTFFILAIRLRMVDSFMFRTSYVLKFVILLPKLPWPCGNGRSECNPVICCLKGQKAFVGIASEGKEGEFWVNSFFKRLQGYCLYILFFSGVFYLGVFMREQCTQNFPEQNGISAFVANPQETKTTENLNLLQICIRSSDEVWTKWAIIVTDCSIAQTLILIRLSGK